MGRFQGRGRSPSRGRGGILSSRGGRGHSRSSGLSTTSNRSNNNAPKTKLEDHVYRVGSASQASDYVTIAKFIIAHIKEKYTKGGAEIVEGCEASVLQSWLDTFNTSQEEWMLYGNRVYFYDKRVIIHKTAPKTDKNGNEIVIVCNVGVAPYAEHYLKDVIHYDKFRIAMGNCKGCKHSGPVGLECNSCNLPFLILYTQGGDVMNHLWNPGKLINSYLLTQLTSSDVYFNFCVHDGKENPLCSAIVDDTLWSSIDQVMLSRNKKYESTINPSDVLSNMMSYGLKIDIELGAETFETNDYVVRSYIAKEGLKHQGYCHQYNILFGKDAWEEGNSIQVNEEEQDDLFTAITERINKRRADGGYDSDDINF